MKYKEYFAEKGLFTIFEANEQTVFTEVFGSHSGNVIDNYAIVVYGDRTMIDNISNDYINSVISISAPDYQQIANLYNTKYDPLRPLSESEEVSSITKDNYSSADENTNGKSAYNDENLKNYEREQRQSTTERAQNVDTQRNIYGLGHSAQYSDILAKEKELRLKSFRLEIINNLVNKVTNNIYE